MIDKAAALAAPIVLLLATNATMSPARSFTTDEILDRNQLSLVSISVTGMQSGGETAFPPRNGTGFFISETGHIITALHVVGQHDLFEKDSYSRVVGRKVKVDAIVPPIGIHTVASDTRNVVLSPYADVAMIKVNPKTGGGAYDPVDDFNTCRPSGDIVALVWRDGRPEAVAGIVKQADETSIGGLVRFGPVAARIEDGDSGGPVFDSEGRLIGVLSGRALNSSDDAYFVPIAAGESLLFNVAQIRPCHELNNAIDGRAMLDTSISDLAERLTRIEQIPIGDGVDEALAELRCVTGSQFEALSSQIDIIFIYNAIERIKVGDLKEDPAAGITQYDLQNRMQNARIDVETMLDRLKDGTCSGME